jgi:hypothetical protein
MNRRRSGSSTEAAETYVIRHEEQPLFPVPELVELPHRRRKWPFVVLAVGLAVAAALAATAVYMVTRGPDLAAFHTDLEQTGELALSLQAETERLKTPAALAGFRGTLADTARRLDELERDALAVDQTRHRLALLDAIDAGKRYVGELETLTLLDRKITPDGRDARALELAAEAEQAYDAAAALDSDPAVVRNLALSPTPVATVLGERHLAWTNYEQRLAAANALRRQHQATLTSLQGFTNRMDGIVARYQDSRDELADWIAGVNAYGTTYTEAYDVLFQQEQRRSQLRDELALLHPPPAFVADQQALLGIMDDSVSALSAASRGVSEYQSDYGDAYPVYRDTPGWQDFEQASNEIADRLDDVLGSYSARKNTVFAPLSKPVQLPEAPADAAITQTQA